MPEDLRPSHDLEQPKGDSPRIRQHLIQVVLRRLVKSKNPLEALSAIKENAAVVAGIIQGELGNRGRKASRQTVAGSFMVGGSLLYWAGWIALPLWVPALGAAIGTLGAAGVVAGFKWWRDAHLNDEFLKTYYTFLHMMEMADGVVTSEERNHLTDFLLSLPLSAGQRKAFLDMPLATVDAIEIPKWYEPAHRESILAGCWSLAFCDGVAASEETLFDSMARKLGVTPEAVLRIKEEVVHMIEETEEILVAIGEQTAALLPKSDGGSREAIIGILATVNARSNPEERLRKALTFVSDPPIPPRFFESQPNLDTILASAYLIAYGLRKWEEPDLKTIKDTFNTRCGGFGIFKESADWMRLTEDAIAAVEQAS